MHIKADCRKWKKNNHNFNKGDHDKRKKKK